jgi:hypothetical protein
VEDILLERVEVDGREAERGFAESLRRQLEGMLVLNNLDWI